MVEDGSADRRAIAHVGQIGAEHGQGPAIFLRSNGHTCTYQPIPFLVIRRGDDLKLLRRTKTIVPLHALLGFGRDRTETSKFLLVTLLNRHLVLTRFTPRVFIHLHTSKQLYSAYGFKRNRTELGVTTVF